MTSVLYRIQGRQQWMTLNSRDFHPTDQLLAETNSVTDLVSLHATQHIQWQNRVRPSSLQNKTEFRIGLGHV